MPKRLHLASGDADFAVNVSGATITVTPGDAILTVARVDDRLRAEGAGEAWSGDAVVAGDTVWVTVAGEVFAFVVTHGAARTRTGASHQDAFTPPMSATVVRIAVKPGDAVKDGDVLIALEAMKMELPIRAPRDGVVRAVNCRQGELVQPGDVLLELE